VALTPSPILGPAGNVEFLVHLVPGREAPLPPAVIEAAVAQAPARAPRPRSRT
jgi:hypothetical protein